MITSVPDFRFLNVIYIDLLVIKKLLGTPVENLIKMGVLSCEQIAQAEGLSLETDQKLADKLAKHF